MKTVSFEAPALYGDHHVIEVRRILFALPGVVDVAASSAFHTIEVQYDPGQINDLELAMKLDEAGYLGEWSLPMETGAAATRASGQAFFRHTEVYDTNRQAVSFAQQVQPSTRPLWSCPGMGVIKNEMED